MKYKLININTKHEVLCEKTTIDGFDYYVSNEEPFPYAYIKHKNEVIKVKGIGEKSGEVFHDKGFNHAHECRKVVATNNPNINAPKVVDEVEELAISYEMSFTDDDGTAKVDFKAGHNKSQETHPFSEEDMIEFAEWIANSKLHGYSKQLYEAMIRYKVSTTKELLQIWKEQQPKVIYYNEK